MVSKTADKTVTALLDLPAQRLCRLLHDSRIRRDLDLAEVARRVEFVFTPVTLAMIEQGKYPLTEPHLNTLLHAYDIDLSAFAGASNLVVRFDAGMSSRNDRLSIDDVIVEGTF